MLTESTAASHEAPYGDESQMADNQTSLSHSKFDETFNVQFQYIAGGRWHQIEINFKEYLEILQTAAVEGRPIVAIELWNMQVQNGEEKEEDNTVHVIYDFMLKNTGRDPWRMK